MNSDRSHPRPKPTKSRRLLVPVVGGIVVSGLLALMYLRFGPHRPPPPPPSATLCDYVQSNLGMRCVAVLADQSQLGPGAVVDVPENAPANSKVPLQEFDLQSVCRIPGSDLSALQPSAPADLALPQFSYEVSRSLKEGAIFDVPQISSATLKAGPNWRSLSRIDVSVPAAWVTSINQISYIENSCSIKQICVDRILAKKYRVVETSAIVKDLGYKLYDKSGTELDFAASVQKGLVATAQGQEHIERKDVLTAKGPMVLAVRFLPDDVIQAKRDEFCKVPVLFTSDGSASVTIAGGGGEGTFAQQQKSAGLNAQADLSAQGGESSECDGGHDRTKSSASVSAVVRSPDPHILELERNISVHGGHYATAASCAFGGAGWTGHDNAASATAQLWGQIRITARNDGAQDLNVAFTDIPPGSTLHITGPSGTVLPAGSETASQNLIGTGNVAFPIAQAGVYLLRVEILASRSTQGGAGAAQDSGTARVSVALNPRGASPSK